MSRLALRATLVAMAFGIALPGLAQPRFDQVSIEARFVEVSRNAAEELGIDWFRPGEGIRSDVIDFGGAPGFSTPFANLNLVIDALEADSLSRVLANPRIATRADGVAEITFNSPVSLPTVNYNQIGIQLTVTPSVVENGVLMEIYAQTGGPTLPQGDYVPIVNQRQLDTSLLLPTGSALAIGGLFPDDAGATAAKVPFLGDIPGLGYLFRTRTQVQNKAELLIFVTPKIIPDSGVIPE
jgi:type IV pilus assembly protein PilQ